MKVFNSNGRLLTWSEIDQDYYLAEKLVQFAINQLNKP